MLFQLLFGYGRTLAYTVHERPDPPSDRMDRAEALRFIKDGFTLPAALTAPIWLASRRLWLGLALYVAGLALIVAAYAWLRLPEPAALAALVAMHLIVGFEADSIERAELERQGWATLGAVTGASALECQRRFFDQWLPLQPVLSSIKGSPPATPLPPRADPRPPVATARGDQSAAGRLAALWKGKPS